MIECREVELLLASYVDGDVPPAHRVFVVAHLAACPSCRRRAACEGAAQKVLHARRDALCTAAPPMLYRRCAACACERSGGLLRAFSGARMTRRTILPLSLAATLLLAVGAIFVYGSSDSVQALAMQLAVDHVTCFQLRPSHGPVDAATASEAWQRSYGWILTVPRSAPVEDLELVDVRRCLSMRGYTAHIMYRWRGAPLSLYVLNRTTQTDADVQQLVSRFGQDAIVWAAGGRTYAVVGRGRRADLEHVAQYIGGTAR